MKDGNRRAIHVSTCTTTTTVTKETEEGFARSEVMGVIITEVLCDDGTIWRKVTGVFQDPGEAPWWRVADDEVFNA